ncbi:MAG: serine protease, partial [Rhodopirellula bahusiensis]
QGITAGDVLLGIHVWQTAGLEDLAEILDQPNIRRGSKAKFYLVRKDQTLYGHLQLASQGNQLTRR